jgi:hypothetical protein
MTDEARRYLAAVEVELSDLDADERSELLADVEEHLSEIEHEGVLEVRLGEPAVYAAELRSSAGFPPKQAAPRRSGFGSWRRVLTGEHVETARRFVAEVQPGWWVLRGFLFVLAFSVVSNSMSQADLPFPRIAGSQHIGFVVAVLAAWGSYRLGRRAQTHGVARTASIVTTAIVVMLTFGALAGGRAVEAGIEGEPIPVAGVHHWDGSEALDICPYDSHGKPLRNVLVFDQAGRPVSEIPRVAGSESEGVLNAYPRGVSVPSADGVLRDARCPKLAKVKIATSDGPSWIEVLVRGTPIYRTLLAEGESRTFFGEDVFLVVGNAGAVDITANGKRIGKPGAMGEVYRGAFDASTKELPPAGVSKPLIVDKVPE